MTESPDDVRKSVPGPLVASGSDATTLSPSAQPSLPLARERITFPGYEILDVLGRGGMAVVYKARQISLRRIVAIKVILSGPHASPDEIARFRIEGESVARLLHPHIVQIYDVGQQEGSPYFALEFVEGGTLGAWTKGKPLDPDIAAQLSEKLARAMDTAHRQGIVHRDLKPSNVLMTSDGQPKISDFGLAKWMDDDTGQTKTGAVMGTPSYMAPEQAAGRKDVGPAADIYGLGAILYELLTGGPPFQAETPLDTVLRVVSDDPVAPRRIRAMIPRNLETICLKCLEKDPRRRYATADLLGDDLERYLRGEPILARPPTIPGRLDRWARSRPALAATLAALTLFYLNHLVLIALGVEGEGGRFHWIATALVAVWGLGASAFQWLVTRTRHRELFIYTWAALDVLLFASFLFAGKGAHSSLLPGYLLLIAGTALRLRPALVGFVTALCLVSYLALLAAEAWRTPHEPLKLSSCLIFTISLGTVGLIQVLLLRRLHTAAAKTR